jgi:hypothetical protein
MADFPLLTLQELLYEPLFGFAEPNIPEMAEGPIYMDMTTPTSADGSSTEPSPAAAAFIAEHTVTVTDAPSSDECPICIDNYGAGIACLQIKNIGDCTQRFCKRCVSALVNENSSADLRCPNCRAVWIPSTTAGEIVDMRASAVARVRALDGRLGDRGYLPPAARPFVPGGRVVIDLEAEEEDYDTQVQNFNQAAREIEDVRARARGTQMSRGQRRQEMQDETTRRRTAGRDGCLSQNRHREPLYPSPLSRRWTRTPARPTQALVVERPSVGNNLNCPILPTSTNPRHGPIPPNNEQASILSTPRPATPPAPDVSCEIEETPARNRQFFASYNRNQDVQREQTLDIREIALNDRAIALNDREKELNDRDMTLNGRATSLGVREDYLKQQEARVNKRLTNALAKEKAAKALEERAEKMVQLAQKQRGEMDKVIKRQREEMDKEMEKAVH